MLFVSGLDKMSKEEKISLLSQINCLTSMNMINQGVQKGYKKTREVVIKGVTKIRRKALVEEHTVNEVHDEILEIDYLKNKMEQEYKKLSGLSEAQLANALKQKLVKLSQQKDEVRDEIIANSIIHRAAKSLNIDVRHHLNAQKLENAVFETYIRKMAEDLKTRFDKMTERQTEDYEIHLRDELSRLSDADQQAIKEALGIDKITADALITFIKTTSSTTIAQITIGGFGFGAFLFLTTSIKAFSLLLGVTFPFAVYTTATTVLAFLISIPFLLVVVAASGGLALRKTSYKIGDEVAKLLVLAGRAKLMR